jgi:hypothetical protein
MSSPAGAENMPGWFAAAIGEPLLMPLNLRALRPIACDFRSGEVAGLVGLRVAGQADRAKAVWFAAKVRGDSIPEASPAFRELT